MVAATLRLDAVDWACQVARLGAGEILLTSMDADGTCGGYDIELTAAVSAAVDIPVIASGGAGHCRISPRFSSAANADAILLPAFFTSAPTVSPKRRSFSQSAGLPSDCDASLLRRRLALP